MSKTFAANMLGLILSVLVMFSVAVWAVQPSARTTYESRDLAYDQLRDADHWSDGYAPSWILNSEEPLRGQLDRKADDVRTVLGSLGSTSDQLTEATRQLTVVLTKIEGKQRGIDNRLYPLMGKGYDK